jgi:hypothetical protein
MILGRLSPIQRKLYSSRVTLKEEQKENKTK